MLSIWTGLKMLFRKEFTNSNITCLQMPLIWTSMIMPPKNVLSTLSQTETQSLDSSKLSLQMTISNLMKMAESSLKWVENTGKRRNCSLRAISP